MMVRQKMKHKKHLLDMLKSLENLIINDVSGSNSDES